MKAFANFVSRHPKLVLSIAMLLAIPAAISALKMPINYDIFSYMPSGVESIEGQLILKEDYKAAGTGFVLLKKDEAPKLIELKDKLAAVEGISDVVWLSDLVDPSVPNSFIPAEILGIYQKDQHVMFHLTFTHEAASDETLAAVKNIKEVLAQADPEGFTGLPVLIQELRELVDKEKVRSIIAAVVISGTVVGIAMGSIITPLIFLFSIGIAILYNMGTNFLQGSVSYVTEAVAAVIQLGVTFDFSIFLTHRFHEETMQDIEEHEAMADAISSTFKAIAPAALTTMAGFMALCLMEVGIGLDMGIVMAKGVFLGMITSITLLPALLLLTHKHIKMRDIDAVSKRHKGGATFLTRHSVALFFAFLLIFVPAVYGRYHTELSYSVKDMLPQDMPAITSIEKIEHAMGNIELAYTLLPEDTPRQVVAEISERIAELETIDKSVSMASLVDPSIPESFIPAELVTKFNKGGYTQIMSILNVDPGTDEGNAAISSIREIVAEYNLPESYVAGTAAISKDMVELSQLDIPKVNKASLLCILLIVGLVFGSVSIPILLVAGIQLAIFINLGIPFYFGNSVPFLAFTVIGSIQLGTTVDYAILLMSRYREERREFMPKEAMIETLTGSMPAIAISGLSLFSATIGLVFISHVDTLTSMALMIGRGALISMLVITCLVPAVILVCDKLILNTSYGWKNSVVREK